MKPWDKDETPVLMLFTPEEMARLPDAAIVEAIDGEQLTVAEFRKSGDNDTRFGCLAYGSRDIYVQNTATNGLKNG